MRRMAAVGAAVVLAVAGCGSKEPGQSTQNGPVEWAVPTAGAAALGNEVKSIDEVAKLVQNLTGECDGARAKKMESLDGWMGDDKAALWRPYLKDWAQCQVGSRTVSMFYFSPGKFKDFQAGWKDALAAGKTDSGPRAAFGNGYGIDLDERHVKALQLRYLRCKPVEELNSEQVPADVDGCVFAETSGP